MPENNKPERAICANNVFFQTTMNCDATTSDRQISTATNKAITKVWSSTLNEMDHDVEHAGNSDDQNRYTFVKTDFPTLKIVMAKLKSFIQSKVESAVEATLHKTMIGLDEEAICDIFNTRYCAATDIVKDSFLSFLENVITRVIRCGV